jgi:hypothetical protein
MNTIMRGDNGCQTKFAAAQNLFEAKMNNRGSAQLGCGFIGYWLPNPSGW